MMIDHCAGRNAVQASFRVNHHVPETPSANRDRQYRTNNATQPYSLRVVVGRGLRPRRTTNKLTFHQGEASLREREPTVAREHINGDDVISTPMVKGAREGARVEIMSGVPGNVRFGRAVGLAV